MPRQLHHVVGAAALRRVGTEFGRELAGVGVPRLAVAGAAGAVRALADHFVPEIFGDIAVSPVAGEFVIPRCSDDLRDVRVDVQTFQFISVRRQRIEELLLVETLRNFQVIIFARDRVQIRKRFAHAAKFRAQHALHVFVAERAGVAGGPVSHLLHHVERLLVAAVNVHIEQAGHDLVNGIEGSPHSLALAQPVEELNRERAEITTLQRSLAFAKFRHHSVGVVLEVVVSRTGIHQRAGRKIVAASIVTTQLTIGSFPSSKRLRGGWNAGVDPKCMQQTIRRQRMQVLAVGFHRDFARTFAQSHLLHGKRARFPGYFLVADGLASFLGRVHHGVLPRSGHQRSRQQS